MPEFESFRRSLVPLKSEPHVTIQKRGAISLNRSAFVALECPHAVELLYDRNKMIIGLRPIASDAENAYSVRHSSPTTTGPYLISAMAFSRFYDIDTTLTRRWPAYLEDGVLCIDTAQEGTPVTSNRAAKKQLRS